jgi:hypothetical protein
MNEDDIDIVDESIMMKKALDKVALNHNQEDP